MDLLNNVNVAVLQQMEQEARADTARAKRVQKVEGEWLLEEGGPQFRAQVSFEGGRIVLESDQPKNLGGGGTRLGPMYYCFFGLVSCYTATFVAMASMMGIAIRKLTASLDADLNFSRVLGLSREPVMEEVHIALQVESDAPREKLEQVERLAAERCPAVFALTERVQLKTILHT